MPSATDFFPSSMTLFMNFDRTMSPNFGSGRISRFSGRRRRDIGSSFSLQPGPEPVRGLLRGRHPGLDPGSTFFSDVRQEEGGPRIKSGVTGGYFGRLAPYLERD